MNELHQHILSKSVYVGVFLILLVLLVLTVAASSVHLGPLNIIVAMTIAVVKALLIILYFMHVRYSSRLIWIFAGGAFFWVGILFVLTMTDFLSRDWLIVPGK
ncbi:MAG: cytochrome C oxidase subunit IV family protein [Candidatus Tectomicrobia bacterium]|uniref:Cytochrome C oxidase subunit IV family protein n=1 Tax=Tectimicrobiota bacterium TaxID=2528274 RepID=A0A932FWD6_UNCTE|nr:cytochrome C oxidase subunit IV family protein [Candidatus Tectomicrobia bacterium]